MEVTRPEDGLGNWYAENPVSLEELSRIPEKLEDEELSRLQRKGIYLLDIRKVPLPGIEGPIKVRLYDNGTYGDEIGDDGIYTNQFSTTRKEGTYSFHIHAKGQTNGNNLFMRERIANKHVTVKPSSKRTEVSITRLPATSERTQDYEISITPRDRFGNYLGPGYSHMVRVTSSYGTLTDIAEDTLDGSRVKSSSDRVTYIVKDTLDGTYVYILSLPIGVDEREVDILVYVGEMEKVVNLAKAIKRKSRFYLP